MQLHELQPEHYNSDKKRIARGGKRGRTSGRGQKGQKSRSGRKMRPAIRDFVQRLPKLRGKHG
jgi:large subunit ribosomal protein L15